MNRNDDLFVGYPEISMSVIVKHVQQIGISLLFVCLGDLLSFPLPRGSEKKLLGYGLLGGSGPRMTL